MKKFRNLIQALEAAPEERLFIRHWIDEDEDETVTFGEFRRRARTQAAMLRSHGVRAGGRVVIILPQGIRAMASFVGAMMVGAVPALIAYPNFKVEPAKYSSGLAGVTANLDAEVVVIDGEFPPEIVANIRLAERTKLLRLGEFEETSAGEEFAIGADPVEPVDALAFIQHSAGTTGLQKGVALTHAAVLTQLEHLGEALKIDHHDRIYSWLPLYHDMGLIACFMLPMVYHLEIVMQSPLDWVMDPGSMLQIISRHKCTLAWMPNFAFQFVPRRARKERWANCDLSSLRALINCSEPVRGRSMKEFYEVFREIGLQRSAMQTSYAMAENVFAVTQSDIAADSGPEHIYAHGAQFRRNHIIVAAKEGSPESISFLSSGRLLPNQELRIVSESRELLEDGRVGEILIKSDCLFDGYFNRPDLTQKAIIDGWYHSGDLGFILDRELYVVGRKKDLLIIGGENIYPQDIEEAATAHPAIHDGRAVALGIYNGEIGTEEIVLVAEVEHELLAGQAQMEQEIRNLIVSATGVAVKSILLKPPKWIVKSTAGKAARSATREKLLREHPEIFVQALETEIT